ncbi:hypothetical protein V8E51_014022 [Hyaloscypha variabilis]
MQFGATEVCPEKGGRLAAKHDGAADKKRADRGGDGRRREETRREETRGAASTPARRLAVRCSGHVKARLSSQEFLAKLMLTHSAILPTCSHAWDMCGSRADLSHPYQWSREDPLKDFPPLSQLAQHAITLNPKVKAQTSSHHSSQQTEDPPAGHPRPPPCQVRLRNQQPRTSKRDLFGASSQGACACSLRRGGPHLVVRAVRHVDWRLG